MRLDNGSRWYACPPEQVAESRVAAEWVPHWLVLIKESECSRAQATFQPSEGHVLFVQGGIDLGDPVRLALARAGHLLQFFNNLECFRPVGGEFQIRLKSKVS